jgi:hypothetical protein
MDLTYLSIASFILTTILYYVVPTVGKISVSIKAFSSESEMEIFKQESNVRLAIYLAVVILTQFVINTTFVINACGGSNISNYGSAFLITFLPWIFIFGVMLITLIMYPGFKGAFADIIGYFFVSNSANEILSQILMSDAVTQSALNGVSDTTVKTDLIRAAESITKMLGNKAIIINQITPLNFISMWNMLKQLMKPTVYENEELKKQLLDVTVMRDNIGESMWFFYTGILIISYTSFKITSATCPPDITNIIKKKVHKVVDKVANKGATTVVNTANKGVNVIVPPVVKGANVIVPPVVKGVNVIVPPVVKGVNVIVPPVVKGANVIVPPVVKGANASFNTASNTAIKSTTVVPSNEMSRLSKPF